MTAALEQVFASATNEDARRAQKSAALDTVLSGPAAEIITLMKNINTAADTIRKSHGPFGRFGKKKARNSIWKVSLRRL